MLSLPLRPRSAFAGLLPAKSAIQGLDILDRDGAGLGTIVVRRGARQAFRTALQAQFGLDLREGPVLSIGENLVLAGSGADSWLAVSKGETRTLGATLAASLTGCAAVCDQSDGYGLLRLSGPNAAKVLQRLLPIDMHSNTFPQGSVASTIAAHIPLLVWRLDEATFELAVFRSYAASFMYALGIAVRPFSRREATRPGRG